MGLLLFNWVGYELYTAILQQRATTSLISRLDDNDYTDSELISFKFPASQLGYYSNNASYDRVDGTVSIEGAQYNYVKRRIYNDSLELLCIPNRTVNRLQTARDDFFKLVNDLQHPGHSKKTDSNTASFKGFHGEYYNNVTAPVSSRSAGLAIAPTAERRRFSIPEISITPAGQPPDRA